MEYQNPIIRGFNPDPSICRVGNDYYLVTSSFEYFPALPIFHSTDLVNWEQIGNCINFDNAIDLTKARESGGIWAPTIRYDNGIFYVTVAMEKLQENSFNNFIIHTNDIYGTWSNPVFVNIGGIDPSLFFEDQHAYYCTNDHKGEEEESIKLGIVNPKTGETLEEFRTIWHGEGGGWLEAPHIYHIGEWYYLLCAEGGTSFGHNAIVARAKDIWGPYLSCPSNPILTNRNDIKKQASCCGHGDLIEDSEGNWWMIHLGHRAGVTSLSALGRETFLTPVLWENEWPMIRDGRARIREDGPISAKQLPWKELIDNFTDTGWPCWWSFVRNPRLSHYERKNGRLTIWPFGNEPKEREIQGFLCTKQPDLSFTMSVNLEFLPEKEGEAAGLLALLKHDFYYFFGIHKKDGRIELFLKRRIDDLNIITWSEEIHTNTVKLMVEGTREDYTFYVLLPNGTKIKKCSASAGFLSNSIAGRGFTGTMVGLYVENTQGNGTPAVFSDFEIRNPEVE